MPSLDPLKSEMEDGLMVNMNLIFGHIEIVQTYRWEGDALVCGCYSINYGMDGKEISRTADAETSRLICPDAETKAIAKTVFRL